MCPGFIKSDESNPHILEYTEDEINRIQSEFITKISGELLERLNRDQIELNNLLNSIKIINNSLSKLNQLKDKFNENKN